MRSSDQWCGHQHGHLDNLKKVMKDQASIPKRIKWLVAYIHSRFRVASMAEWCLLWTRKQKAAPKRRTV